MRNKHLLLSVDQLTGIFHLVSDRTWGHASITGWRRSNIIRRPCLWPQSPALTSRFESVPRSKTGRVCLCVCSLNQTLTLPCYSSPILSAILTPIPSPNSTDLSRLEPGWSSDILFTFTLPLVNLAFDRNIS